MRPSPRHHSVSTCQRWTILLYQGAKGSLNIRSAFIHMVGDTLATVGVIIGSLLILFFNIHLADPIITAFIALYIAVHGSRELQRAIRLLMDSAPAGFDFDAMVEAVLAIDGVHDLQHVHLWRLDEQRTLQLRHGKIGIRWNDSSAALKRCCATSIKSSMSRLN